MTKPKSNLGMILAAVLFAAIVVGVVWVTGDFGKRAAPPSASVADAAAQGLDSIEQTPLPSHVTTLQAAIDLASREARSWRDDAVLTRAYATSIAHDGALDRQSSELQMVYVSPSATSTGAEKNGWRWSAKGGAYGSATIWQLPAPELGNAVSRLCDLAPLVPDDAPERFTVDAQLAAREGHASGIALFTRAPKRWMLLIDAASCQVRERSRPLTVQEENERDASTGSVDGGVLFDARAARASVSQAISSASECRVDGGARGRGTVEVTFDRGGRAEKVQFLAGAYGGTNAGRCLERRLLRLRVGAWTLGEGRTVERFDW